jgi:hypothetical protein
MAALVARLTAGLGRIVEQGIRIVAAGLKFSRKYEAAMSAEHNHVRLERELNKSFGPAFAPSAVSARDEITESQRQF